MTPADILQRLQASLAENPDPLAAIERFAARSTPAAIAWARNLPLWDGYRGRFPAEAVGLARLLSKRAMKEYRLAFDEEGRVVEKPREGYVARPKSEEQSFPLQVDGSTIEVGYRREYFAGTDLFSFVGEELPPVEEPGFVVHCRKPHPLSPTGYWSHFAPHDAVEAFGGPERFAALYAEAKLKGEDKALEVALTGKRPEVTGPRRRPVQKQERAERVTKPVIGRHTAAVLEEPVSKMEPESSAKQGRLF